MERHVMLRISLTFVFLVLKPLVFCGQCSVDSDCTDTDFTSAVCASNLCACKYNDYTSIRTGCGKKLTTPVAAQEAGRNTDICVGFQGVLTCSTVAGATSYAWYHDGIRTTAATQNISITQAGTYECQAVASIDSLNSHKSAALTIMDITDQCYIPDLHLVIDSPRSNKLYSEREITVSCNNLPIGYNGNIVYMIGSVTIVEVTSSLSSHFMLTAVNSGKTLTCNPGPSNGIIVLSEGSVVLPTLVTNLAVTSVSLVVEDAMGPLSTDTTYNVGAEGPTITCKTTPVPEALDTATPPLYEFLDDATVPNSKQSNTSNIYKVDTSVTSVRKYRCRVGNIETGLSTTITVSDNFIVVPTIIKESAEGITVGSTLVLSCGDSTYSADSYQWSFNDNDIDRQYDKKIQLYNFTEADIGVYKCRAVKSRYITAYTSFIAIMKPTITRETPGTLYAAGGDYVLKCNSGSSLTLGWTYSWKKESDSTTTQSVFYIVNNAAAATHDGAYTCTSSYNGVTSTSDALAISIIVLKPTIICETCGAFFGRYGDYDLRCDSGSNSSGWTYSWTKNNEETTSKTATYKIIDAREATHNGVYTCTSTHKGVSNTSDGLIITIEAPGKRCTADSDCTYLKYKGTCTTTSPKVCECASEYKLKGDDCFSGAAAFISSVLMVVMITLHLLVF